ncbi:TPA_asm: outer membrane permeability protein SanA, partial [Salmonella enterica subsp. enterica serovar Enteritidis]|nr:outer membrane permeability protein SanA [Salmonella enterica subsp. enterica serovar Enteritidis]
MRYVFGYSSLIVLSSWYRVSCMLKRVFYSLLVLVGLLLLTVLG